MQNLMQIHCSPRSVILNAMVTQCTCSLNSIYLTGKAKLLLFTHVILDHSPWLPGHINDVQTILVILTTARLFPDRPRVCVCVCVCVCGNLYSLVT